MSQQRVQIQRDYTGAAPPTLLPGAFWGELGTQTKLYIGTPTGNRLLLSTDPAAPAITGITAVNAGHGLSGGGTIGAVTLSLVVPVAIVDGGTGATTAAGARANLGVPDLVSPNFTGIPTIGGVPIATTTYVNTQLANYLPLTGGTLSGPGNLTMGPSLTTGVGLTTGDAAIELGGQRTGAGNAYVDFHSDPAVDFDFRIIRAAGVNGGATLVQNGIGDLQLQASRVMAYKPGGNDPLWIEADNGRFARLMTEVSGARRWSTGTRSDGWYAIADENAGAYRITIDTGGNINFVTAATASSSFHAAAGATIDSLTVNTGFHVTSGGQIDGDLSVLGGGTAISAPSGNISTGGSVFIAGTQLYNYIGYVRTPNGLWVDGPTQLNSLSVNSIGVGGNLTCGSLNTNGIACTTIDTQGNTIFTHGGPITTAGGEVDTGNIFPITHGAYLCGGSSLAWGAVESFVYYTVSSAALKDDIATIDAARSLAVLDRLRPVTFRYKDLPAGDLHYGFIAEEVAAAFGDGSVVRDGSIAYQELIPLLCAAIQDLSRRLPV